MVTTEQSTSANQPVYNPDQSQRLFVPRFLGGCGSVFVFGLSTLALAGEAFIPEIRQVAGEIGVIATTGVVFISGAATAVAGIGLRRLYHEDLRRMQGDHNNNNSSTLGASQH